MIMMHEHHKVRAAGRPAQSFKHTCRKCPNIRNNFRSTFVQIKHYVTSKHLKMLATRTLARSRQAFQSLNIRAFSSSPINAKLKLAYDFYEVEKPESKKDPIVFIHGLFGSKKNNRSMSKSVHLSLFVLFDTNQRVKSLCS